MTRTEFVELIRKHSEAKAALELAQFRYENLGAELADAIRKCCTFNPEVSR